MPLGAIQQAHAIALGADQTSPLQLPQLAADVRLGKARGLDQRGDIERSLLQLAEQLQPGGLGKQPEELADLLQRLRAGHVVGHRNLLAQHPLYDDGRIVKRLHAPLTTGPFLPLSAPAGTWKGRPAQPGERPATQAPLQVIPLLCAYAHRWPSGAPLAVPAASSLLAAAAGGGPLLFRQLFDAATGTFTYLLATGEGGLIDPVFEQQGRDLSLIQEPGIHLRACLDTHAHADQVTGSWLMHQAIGSAIGQVASLLPPLPELEQRRGEIPAGRPVVLLCPLGSRSALATQRLRRPTPACGAWRG